MNFWNTFITSLGAIGGWEATKWYFRNKQKKVQIVVKNSVATCDCGWTAFVDSQNDWILIDHLTTHEYTDGVIFYADSEES